MPANRFYFDGPLEKGESIELQGPEHHHLSRVMRIAVGEEVEIVNGKGGLAIAKTTHIQKDKTRLLLESLSLDSPASFRIILAIPYMRPNKLEWIVEKAVELGADEVRLYAAEYSEKLRVSANALERLEHLAISALKQSGRLFLPSLALLSSLQEALKVEGALFFGDTQGGAKSLLQCDLSQTTLFASGPERGFSPDELKLLQKKATGVRLSPYILRAETAPLVALSVLQSRIDHSG